MVTLRTEAVAYSPMSSSASPSDSPSISKVMSSSPSSSPEILPGTGILTTGSRMLSKKGWQELKPTIRHLYLDQNRTLKQLAEYIQEYHGIKPTKKQLTHRISSWGFEKNVKREERRAIIQSLGPEMKTSSFDMKLIRGRTLGKAKLNRWMKLEGVSFEGGKDEQIEESRTPVISNNRMKALVEKALDLSGSVQMDKQPGWAEESPPEESPLARPPSDPAFNWKVVDIVGSPGLGRFIGALTVETCEDVPFLDLATGEMKEEKQGNEDVLSLCYKICLVGKESAEYSDESTEAIYIEGPQDEPGIWSMPSKTAHNSSNINFAWTFHLNFPQNELYPFPSRARTTSCDVSSFFPPISSELSDSECERQFRRLRRLEVEEAKELVASMAWKADKYGHYSEYRLSEKWYRCVVTATEKLSEPRPYWTLAACLGLIEALNLSGRFAEARDLHQDLHIKILDMLGPNHPLGILSRYERKRTLRYFGKQGEEEKTCRELLQTYLNRQGTGDKDTICLLTSLGVLLYRQEKYQESEQLLRIVISLWNRPGLVYSDPSLEYFARNERDVLLAMLHLAELLTMTGRWAQSKTLLEEVKNRFPKMVQSGSRFIFRAGYIKYHHEVARVKRFAGNWEDCEKILRELFKRQGASMISARKWQITRDLGEILSETDRLEEAVSWFEREFIILLENVGLENPLMKASCKRVGFCYARLGKHDAAILHFKQMIERLTLDDPQSIDARLGFLQEINGWMKEVDGMRFAAWVAPYLDSEENTAAEDTPTEGSSEDELITLENPWEGCST